MLFGKKRQKTAAEQANRTQVNTLVRLIAIAWLGKIIYDIVTDEGFKEGGAFPLVAAIVLGLAGLAIAVLTIIEIVKKIRAGAYKPNYYDKPKTEDPPPADDSDESL